MHPIRKGIFKQEIGRTKVVVGLEEDRSILVGPSLTIGTGVLGLVWRKTSRRPVQCRTTAGRDGTSRDGGGEGAETGGESGFFLEYCFVGEKKWESMGE